MLKKALSLFLAYIFVLFYTQQSSVFAQNSSPEFDQALLNEIFPASATPIMEDASDTIANTEDIEEFVEESQLDFMGPPQSFEEEDLNAIDAALVKNSPKGDQLIDLDIRTRPVYRYDTIRQPKEFINNRGSAENSHLPQIYTNNDMKRILFDAIAIENIQVLNQLLKSGDVDFEMRDRAGNTLLDYAIKNKKYKVVKFLMYNAIGSKNRRVDYLDLALQYNNPKLIDIIEGISPYESDKFNENHVIRALSLKFPIAAVSDIYDELTTAEKYQLFNYFADQLDGHGLEFMALQDYNIDRKMRTGQRVLEYGIIQGRYEEVDQLMWLKKYFSHDHVYSAYQKLTSQPIEHIQLAPQIASYGFNYELENDIRDREYVFFCDDINRPRFDLDSRKKIKMPPFVRKDERVVKSHSELHETSYDSTPYDGEDCYSCGVSDD